MNKDKFKGAKVLLERNKYSKNNMPSSTRRIYESYNVPKELEEAWIVTQINVLKEQCEDLIDLQPLYSIIYLIKEYQLYQFQDDLIQYVNKNLKNKSYYGKLNLYDVLFQYWYSDIVDKTKLKKIYDYLDAKVQELFYFITLQPIPEPSPNKYKLNFEDFDELELKEQERYVLNRCNIIMNALHNN